MMRNGTNMPKPLNVNRSQRIGVFLAAALCLGLGVFINETTGEFPQREQELFEGSSPSRNMMRNGTNMPKPLNVNRSQRMQR
jgi:hypothetical protein